MMVWHVTYGVLLFGLFFITAINPLKPARIIDSRRYKRGVNYKFKDVEPSNITEYFCSRNDPVDIWGELEGKIITRFKGKYSYENNQFCQWNVHAGVGRRIQILVDQWKFQYAPTHALCDGYDHLKVKDDKGFSVSWCQALPIFKSPFYLTSRGYNVSIVFHSDQTSPKNQQYPGASLRFTSFDANGCPPNWLSYKDNCFTLKHVAQSWSDGQKTCNLEQANLASITSQDQFDFLQMAYMGYSGKTWFGLNDKSVFGAFKWINNNSAVGTFAAMSSIKAHRFNHCGLVNFRSGSVGMGSCEGEAAVLCQSERGKVSRLYPIPLFKTDKGSEEESSKGRVVLIGVLIPCAVVLVAIIVGILIYRKRDKFNCIQGSGASDKRFNEQANQEEFTPMEPSAPPPNLASCQDIPLPTYEEAMRSHPI